MTTAQQVRRWLSRRKKHQQLTRRRKFLMGNALVACAAAWIATAIPGVLAAPPELLRNPTATRLEETQPNHAGAADADTESGTFAWAAPRNSGTHDHNSGDDALPPIISASEYDEDFRAEFGGEVFGMQDGITFVEPAPPLRGLAEVQTNRLRVAGFQQPADDPVPSTEADLKPAPIVEAPALQVPTIPQIELPVQVTSSADKTSKDAIPNVEDFEVSPADMRPARPIRRTVEGIEVGPSDVQRLNRREPEPAQFTKADGEFVITEPYAPGTIPPEGVIIGEPIPMDGQIMMPPGEEWGSPAMGADCGFRCPGLIYVQADALAFRRTGTRRTTLSQAFRLDRFNFEPAARITLGRRYDCLDGWEATYIGPLEWKDRGSITGTNLDSFLLPDGGVDISAFNDATFHGQSYTARLNSFEMNRKWWGWDVFAASLGFRYIRYNEELRFASTTEAGDFGGYRTKTENDLLGGQLGLDLAQPMGRWTFVGKFKGGLYANFADSRTTLINSGTVQFDNEADKTRLAGSIELGYHTMYALTPNVSLRSGYDAWWLIGLALAPEQDIFRVNPLSGTRLDTRGDFFVHGWSAGVEMVW